MKLEDIEDLHTRSQRHDVTAEDREAALATIPTLLALVKNLRGDNATHEGGVREILRARAVDTGRLQVVFYPEEPGRPQVMDATVFDDRYPLLKDAPPEPVFHVHKTVDMEPDEHAPQWQCRSCRQLFDHELTRHFVRDELERDCGEWCEECVVARVHKPN